MIDVKSYKYNQSIKKYNELFCGHDNKINNTSFVLFQANGLTGQQLNKLTQVLLYQNMNIIYLNNVLKKQLINNKYYKKEIMNNEIFLIAVPNILKDLKFLFNFIQKEKLEDNLLRLCLLLKFNNKLKNKSFSYYDYYLLNNSCNSPIEIQKALYKVIKVKLITLLLKLKQILNANIQSIKKASK
uniref:Uncharacterized protein orf184 n=1 Tax=Heterostelium pallidum TaxID=13642 RepID=Q5ILL5_HETPA|nr:hypothetical protein PopaoMp09 [Heterostelium pallidum]AAU00595.1 unknown [Heterostelium pallidum]